MITPENAIPPAFARRLDVWRFRYWDRVDEFWDLYDPESGPPLEVQREMAAEGLRPPIDPPPSALPASTGKAA